MNSNMFVKYDFFKEVKKFRQRMGADLFIKLKTWEIARDKVQIVKDNFKILLILDWVKFIAVSGSVAAGTVEKEDDIDILVVVKNNRLWIYRLLLFLKNFSNENFMHFSDSKKGNCANKLEPNYILEERALNFEESFFSLHELICLIPIYKIEYYSKILLKNKLLFEKYKYREFLGSYTGSRVCAEENVSREVFFLKVINLICFISQFLYSLRNGVKKENIRHFLEWYRKGVFAVWQLYPKKNVSS